MRPPKAVYIHIPFCATKCFYCDFTAYVVDGQPVDDYLTALEQEIALTVDQSPPGEIESVFIGGGTPTILTPAQMERLLTIVAHYFPAKATEMEYTMEANPGTTTPELLAVMRAGGVNRLSFGAQTFNPHLLQAIGRSHGVTEIAQSVNTATEAGFQNISLDLMFGLPNQTVQDVQQTVEQALQLPLNHFSCYSLKVEEGTLFHHWEQAGQLPLPDEEEEYAMYQWLRKTLPKHGFEQYEVSNFAKRGYESKHNMTYWRNKPYFGFGAGAHGYVAGNRHANVRGIREYIEQIAANKRPVLHEDPVPLREQMENFFILGLRLRDGVNVKQFQAEYGQSAEKVFGDVLKNLTDKKMLSVNGDILHLTEQGLLFGNDVFAQFLDG
jgi:oxygen-independent coproporphyrinogen-3 oxidase